MEQVIVSVKVFDVLLLMIRIQLKIAFFLKNNVFKVVRELTIYIPLN